MALKDVSVLEQTKKAAHQNGVTKARAGGDLDDRIIEALRADGRMSNSALARRLGVTETTVRKHLRRLTETHRMQVVAVADPYRLGYETDTNIGLQVQVGKIITVAEQLAALPEVRYVGLSTGAYDIIIAAMFRSNADLLRFLTETLVGITDIQRIETSHILRVLKRTYDWVAPGADGDT